ncbi:hypothetical protein [Sporomusa sp. KB1]|nr:hypothetical protein [Sporomusa sp. KB1]
MLHCNQKGCRFCDEAKLLCQTEAYLVGRRCITLSGNRGERTTGS